MIFANKMGALHVTELRQRNRPQATSKRRRKGERVQIQQGTQVVHSTRPEVASTKMGLLDVFEPAMVFGVSGIYVAYLMYSRLACTLPPTEPVAATGSPLASRCQDVTRLRLDSLASPHYHSSGGPCNRQWLLTPACRAVCCFVWVT